MFTDNKFCVFGIISLNCNLLGRKKDHLPWAIKEVKFLVNQIKNFFKQIIWT